MRGAINAVVQTGLAYAAVHENSQVEVPATTLHGKTHEKMSYQIRIAGIGKLSESSL